MGAASRLWGELSRRNEIGRNRDSEEYDRRKTLEENGCVLVP